MRLGVYEVTAPIAKGGWEMQESRVDRRPEAPMKYALTTSLVVAVTLAAAAMNGGVTAMAAPSCESVKALTLPDTTITLAQAVDPGAFTPPVPADGAAVPPAAAQAIRELPAFCRVTATLKPTSDSDIKIEVWLPVSGWNGKLQSVGNGGWAGVIGYPALAAALAHGYAAAATDTGHVGNSADFALGHPEKLIDFGYRSIHEMTVQAKAIVQAYYGTGPRLSYFNGCSTGGRQAITEAQRYPADFNGIVAGASAWNAMRMHAARTVVNLMVNKEADHVIPPSKYPMIHSAVLDACDALDGAKDGVIENPTRCHFDYAILACKGGDGTDCLTKGQVASAKVMTSPLKDPKTGRVLYEGHLWPGSELGWATLGGPAGYGNATTALKNIAFKDPRWDYRTFDVSTEMERASQSDNGVLYSGDPNLKPFFDRGGKLLMYQGWADPQVTPQASVIYYSSVVKMVGNDKAANSIALFMVPGMNHCQGGIGTDTFDKVGTLEQWVEQGKIPTTILASHLTNGHVDRTRPLCPYPQVAEYKGTGSTDDAGNFICKMR
jgi:feruloyl esterase